MRTAYLVKRYTRNGIMPYGCDEEGVVLQAFEDRKTAEKWLKARISCDCLFIQEDMDDFWSDINEAKELSKEELQKMRKMDAFRYRYLKWMRKENLNDYDVDVIRDGVTFIKGDNFEIICVVLVIPTLYWRREYRIETVQLHEEGAYPPVDMDDYRNWRRIDRSQEEEFGDLEGWEN